MHLATVMVNSVSMHGRHWTYMDQFWAWHETKDALKAVYKRKFGACIQCSLRGYPTREMINSMSDEENRSFKICLASSSWDDRTSSFDSFFFRHPSLSAITFIKSFRRYPVSAQSRWMQVFCWSSNSRVSMRWSLK